MYLEKAEEKFTVLYTVKTFETPIDITRLFEIMTWEKQVMEYFELSEIVFELSEDGYIEKKFYRNEEAYVLTDKGEEACRLFAVRVPPSVKERINDAIGKIKYDEVFSLDYVKAEVLPADNDSYDVRCSLGESGKNRFEMTINFENSKLSAKKACENFKANGNKIYNEILKLILPDENE